LNAYKINLGVLHYIHSANKTLRLNPCWQHICACRNRHTSNFASCRKPCYKSVSICRHRNRTYSTRTGYACQ
jgi:hypothetical protein